MTAVQTNPVVRLEIASQPELLAGARALIAAMAQRCGFNEIQCGQISLAVDEALCNIIKHGYNCREDERIWISISIAETQPKSIKIIIEDTAEQIEVSEIRSRDLDDVRPGGLGVHIIKEIMDVVEYEHRQPRGMRLTLIKTNKPSQANESSEQKT